MSKDDCIRMTGVVVDVLPSTNFRVQITEEHSVLAYMSGKMRKAKIRIILGDTVDLEISPYDLTKARIVYRVK